MVPQVLSPNHERGYYIIWDTNAWRKERVVSLALLPSSALVLSWGQFTDEISTARIYSPLCGLGPCATAGRIVDHCYGAEGRGEEGGAGILDEVSFTLRQQMSCQSTRAVELRGHGQGETWIGFFFLTRAAWFVTVSIHKADGLPNWGTEPGCLRTAIGLVGDFTGRYAQARKMSRSSKPLRDSDSGKQLTSIAFPSTITQAHAHGLSSFSCHALATLLRATLHLLV